MLENKYQQAAQKADKAEMDFQKMKFQTELLQKDNAQMRQQISELQFQLGKAQAENSNHIGDVQGKSAKLEVLEQRLVEQNLKNEMLQKENRDYQSKVRSLEDRFRMAEQQFD